MSTTDTVYLRHPPLGEGDAYADDGIPGFRTRDQSSNSHELNNEGQPIDVLIDSRTGTTLEGYDIASISAAAVRTLVVPHERSVMKKGGVVEVVGQDLYSFDIIHAPVSCMYPHCEIITKKNGEIVKEIASNSRSAMREAFGQLAVSVPK